MKARLLSTIADILDSITSAAFRRGIRMPRFVLNAQVRAAYAAAATRAPSAADPYYQRSRARTPS